MDLGAILDVAIGIIFVWIVLSLTTIQIQEWITTKLDKRAKDMEDAIEQMLSNEDLKAQLYDHPVIRGLMASKSKEPWAITIWLNSLPIIRNFTKQIKKLPSYIPRQQFSLALFDIARSAGTESSLIQQRLLKIRNDLQKEQRMSSKDAVIVEMNVLIDLARSAAATEAGTAFTKNTADLVKQETQRFLVKHPQLKPVVEKALAEVSAHKTEIDELLKREGAPKGDDSFATLQRGIAALSVISPEVNQTLNALLSNVEDYVQQGESHIARARQNVEKWFDDSMDRVSGVFKRYSQRMALIIGFTVALILNVDSINLTLYLWRDPSVREVLVAQASTYELPQEQLQTDPKQAVEDLRYQFIGLNLPVGWSINPITNEVNPKTQKAEHSCRLFPKTGDSFGVPLLSSGNCLSPSQANDETNLLTKLAGIFITALAAMQGAPFWFDMLKRVVNLRGTGPNPSEKAK